MPIPFIMPKMDMDQEEVLIDQWLKKEGDHVEKGETVIIIETDKITSEVEAPATGTLTRLRYHEQESAPVTKIVAYILEEGETEADLPQNGLSKENHQELDNQNLTDTQTTNRDAFKFDSSASSTSQPSIKFRVATPATPLARRIASEQAVNISLVKGTGPRGRVQAADVKTFISEERKGLRKEDGKGLSGKTISLNTMRQRIAQRLTESYQSVPHIYQTVEIDMSHFEAERKIMNQLTEKENHPRISLTAGLIKITAECLRRHPFLNATLAGDKISLWNQINIGIATALEDGLIVPVIHHADQLTIQEINRELKVLTAKAQAAKLEHQDIQDGTFTISNMGMYGIHSFTSIINPPQSGILSVGAIKRRPVVIDAEDSINVRSMMMVTLAADHRIVDGAIAANFLIDLVENLENTELEIF